MIQFRRGFKRNDKSICLSTTRFIAHLVNQQVVSHDFGWSAGGGGEKGGGLWQTGEGRREKRGTGEEGERSSEKRGRRKKKGEE